MTTSLKVEETEDLDFLGGEKTYVLDTSVLLSDPKAIYRFGSNHIVIPITVVRELESKRHDPELGYFARKALREFEALRKSAGTLAGMIFLPDEGSIEFDIQEMSGIKNDQNILNSALAAHNKGSNVVLVSKDLPMRILASLSNITAEEYRAELASDAEWSGFERRQLDYDIMQELFDKKTLRIEQPTQPPVNTGVVFRNGSASALTVYIGNDEYTVVEDDEVFGVAGRSAEQKVAISHLLAEDVGIVSIGGNAGTGKSALALLAGIEAVLEYSKYKKVIVFRPLYSVGGQELGYLPGDQDEKMNPWAQAVYDTLEPLVSKNVMDEIIARNMIEVLPLTHIRGRSLHDAYVIVDEAQSLERNVILTVLSRMGKNSKVVLTHDVAQRDNLRVGRYDGIVSVIEALKGNNLFAHITLRKSERSKIAELVTNLLDF